MKYYFEKAKGFIKLDIKIIKDFGIRAAYYDFLKNFIFRKNEGIGKRIYFKKYENIKRILKDQYADIVNNYCKISLENSNYIERDSNIWILWWQGINENTPQLVLDCINSVKRHSGQREVVVITKDNVREFVDLPLFYYSDLEANKMTITSFSDLLRIELLCRYGGIWTDASFYWDNDLPEEIYSLPFYTIKHGLLSDFHVCKGLWTLGFMASGRNNPMFEYLNTMFRQYWSDRHYFVCYLVLDCFIAIGYENWRAFKDCVDKVPWNNRRLFFIDEHGNEQYDDVFYRNNISDTHVFRVHYKKKFIKETDDKKVTYYNYITRER